MVLVRPDDWEAFIPHCSLTQRQCFLRATLDGVDRGLLNHMRTVCLAADHRADYHANVAGSHFTVFRPMIERHLSRIALSHSASSFSVPPSMVWTEALPNRLRAACLAADHRADYHANVAGSRFTVFRPMIERDLSRIALSHSASSFSVPPSMVWTEALLNHLRAACW